MLRFLIGLAVGFFVGSVLSKWMAQEGSEKRASEVLDRANAVLVESRRVLDEARKQAAEKIEAGLKEVATKTEGVREAVEVRAGEVKEKAEQVRERVVDTAGTVLRRREESAGDTGEASAQ